MSDISIVDSNLKVETNISEDDICFYDVKQIPFKVDGVFYEGDRFRRLPENIAKSISTGVYELHANTAGGRVRFKTDSPYVAIHCKMPSMCRMPHGASTGSAGFDLYVHEVKEKYIGTFVPPYNSKGGYESIIYLGDSQTREITINFPLYSEVSELYIGLKNYSLIQEPRQYNIEKPIVYYGSSITQGGCASRPGNSYQSIVSRKLDANYINLGFSGSAKAEDGIIEYIKNLDMSVFVYDYDHNSPSIEHLSDTHEKMFLTIRNAKPNMPIIIMPRPKFYLNDEEKERFNIIKKTYDNAISRGDNNVYFIDGKALMQLAEDNGTVDGCHPNDLGFTSIANAIVTVMNNIF